MKSGFLLHERVTRPADIGDFRKKQKQNNKFIIIVIIERNGQNH